MRSSETDKTPLAELIESLADLMTRKRLMLVTVESCTGGGVAHAATSIAGSSNWFDRGWVTYSNSAKSDLVGVDPVLIHTHGAVSEPVARAMVRGALQRCGADRVAVAITGIAGPDGGTREKPVGTVFIGWGIGAWEHIERHHFSGDRAAIREASVCRAIEGAIQWLAAESSIESGDPADSRAPDAGHA